MAAFPAASNVPSLYQQQEQRDLNAYYAELRQRIIDRHLQEQRDLIQVESRARPRVLAEEQAEFFDTAKHFRALHHDRAEECACRRSHYAA